MFSKNSFKTYLFDIGVKTRGNKVHKAQAMKVFGGVYTEPQWILLSDYKIKIPENYIPTIEKEESQLNRLLFHQSVLIGRYGTYLTKLGDKVVLDGVVYHYVLKSNPRNVHYGFRLFLSGEVVARGSGIHGLSEAQAQCNQKALILIEKELFDL
jgi:hypothetical protein